MLLKYFTYEFRKIHIKRNIPGIWIRRVNIVEISTLPKGIFRSSVVLVIISYFIETVKIILKFLRSNKKQDNVIMSKTKKNDVSWCLISKHSSKLY